VGIKLRSGVFIFFKLCLEKKLVGLNLKKGGDEMPKALDLLSKEQKVLHLRRLAKAQAYKEGKTFREFILEALREKLERCGVKIEEK